MNKFYATDETLIPARSTRHSAGYDFVLPYDVTIQPQEIKVVDSGVRVKLDKTKYLALHIRSSLGVRGVMLAMCTGIVDSDYYKTGNTIKGVLYNASKKVIHLKKGERYMQGIISGYYKVQDEKVVEDVRKGGFGSTGK